MNSLLEERGDKFKKEEYIVKEGTFTKSNRHSPLGADKPRVSLNDSIDR
ncbi:MAG: hypothetical protein JJ909_00950 [Roseivirga sp.]|nr:hypothetical protein [Roseivirga sp.]MBO6759529.1 hypothetical protein [Roseivirga sp.]